MLLPPASVLLLRAQDLPGFGSGLCSKAYLLFCLRGEQVKVSLQLEGGLPDPPLWHIFARPVSDCQKQVLEKCSWVHVTGCECPVGGGNQYWWWLLVSELMSLLVDVETGGTEGTILFPSARVLAHVQLDPLLSLA